MRINSIKQNGHRLYQQLRKGILQVFSASVVNKVVVMFSNMVLTRMLVQNEYGILSYAGNVYAYASLIMGFGLVAGALQFGTENRGQPAENKFYRYCASAGILVNLCIIVAFTIAFMLGDLPFPQARTYIYVYLPLLIIQYLIQLLFVIFRSQRRFKVYAKMQIIETVITASGTCLGTVWGINGVIMAKYIASIMTLLLVCWQIRDILYPIIRAGSLSAIQKKELWHYSIFNGVSSVFNQFLFLIDISMLAILMVSTQKLAIYKVATLIPNALSFIPHSVVICIVPYIVARNRDVPWLKQTFKKTFLAMLVFNLSIGLFLILLAPWIIQIIAGKQYLASVAPFRILVAGYCVAGTFRSLSVNFLAALKIVKWNAVCSVLSCLTDVLLNLLLIPKFGILGAAYATFGAEVISSLLTFGGLMYMLKRLSCEIEASPTCQ